MAPVDGGWHDEILPQHEEDGWEDAGDQRTGKAGAAAVPVAVEHVQEGVAVADGHRRLIDGT